MLATEFFKSRSHLRRSWLGSFQLFMMYAPGVIVGRAFDAGYLYALRLLASHRPLMLFFPKPSDHSGRVVRVRRLDLHALPRATGEILPGMRSPP